MVYFIGIIVYNTILLVGTAWLVDMHGWNPWWFALAVGLLANSTKRLCEIDCDGKECKKR